MTKKTFIFVIMLFFRRSQETHEKSYGRKASQLSLWLNLLQCLHNVHVSYSI